MFLATGPILIAIAGSCASDTAGPKVNDVTLADFARAPAQPLDVVQGASSEGGVPDPSDELPVINDGSASSAPPPMAPGRRWIVDSLVGQINGRPIYASRFFEPIEDRILRVVAEKPHSQARVEVQRIVTERFQQFVDNELVIAEAESMLSPEQQEGLLGFLRDMQEQTIAGYGGSRASAQQSLNDQFGMGIDEYMVQRRDEVLAQDLLRRRVNPRVIVSWRDVERAYTRNSEAFNQQPRIVLGRIRISLTDELKLNRMRELVTAQSEFALIAEEFQVEDGGLLGEFVLTEAGIDGLDLSDDVKGAIRDLPLGKLSEPVTMRSSVVWYCVIERHAPEFHGLFDADVQLRIRGQLQEMRRRAQQYRYLSSLRNRWISGDVDQMERRLVQIAFQRYVP